MNIKRLIASIVLSPLLSLTLFGTQLYRPRNIEQAYTKKTRSVSGKPGPAYWQNRADHQMEIKIDPERMVLVGHETIRYKNNSPDSLDHLIIYLYGNLYRMGVARDEVIDPRDLHSGVQIQSLSINDQVMEAGWLSKTNRTPRTRIKLMLFKPLQSGKLVKLEIHWQQRINKYSHIRDGRVDRDSLFLAYFYPRIAVYDDIDGWNRSEYSGTSEFYNDFGNYDVTVKLPAGYIAWATGILQNPQEIFKERILNRYRRAQKSRKAIPILENADLKRGNFLKNGSKGFRFKAENVNDFAIAISRYYCWYGQSLQVDSKKNRNLFLDIAFSPRTPGFLEIQTQAAQAIQYMSGTFPGVPFPYPALTVFQGKADMEYPMMVNDAYRNQSHANEKLTFHEIFHSYFPFYTGLNETKYAWMDEGLTSFADSRYMESKKADTYTFFYFHHVYRDIIGDHSDLPIFAQSNLIRSPSYYGNAYSKAAVLFMTLENYIGPSLFKQGIQAFVSTWKHKHPTPYDLIHILERISGKELNWILKPWLFSYGYVDLAIEKIVKSSSVLEITVLRKGLYPVPVLLTVFFRDGTTKRINRNVSVWQQGNRRIKIRFGPEKAVKQISVGDYRYNDADPSNNLIRIE